MRQLLEQWSTFAYHFALRLTLNRHLAEDLTQEALLRAWQNRRQLQDPQKGKAWLFRILVNLWRDYGRQQQSPVAQASPLAEEPFCPQISSEEQLAQQEEIRRALQWLDALPDRQREVLYLSAHEEMSTLAISEILQISLNAVKVNLSLARKKMREHLSHATAIRNQP